MAETKKKKTEKKKKSASDGDKKKKVSFAVAVVLFCAMLAGSVVLFVMSSLYHSDKINDFTKSAYPIKYEYYVEKYSKKFGVDVCLVYGVIRTESGFDPNAVSNAGAIGLMQIMPDTFTWLQNYRTDFMPEELIESDKLYDPETNIEYGVFMLKYLLDHYDGETSLAIIAYNAGYGNVDSWLSDGTIPKKGVTSADVPFSETANYLSRVTEAMEMYRKLYYEGISIPEASSAAASENDEQTDAETIPDSEAPTEEQTDEQIDEQLEDQTEYGEYAYEGDGTGYEYGEW